MPYMQSDFYLPQIQAGQLAEQKSLQQLRQAEVQKMQQDQANQQQTKDLVRQMWQGTGVSADGSSSNQEGTGILQQISEQKQTATRFNSLANKLMSSGDIRGGEEAYKQGRESLKSAEDLEKKETANQLKKFDSIARVLGPVTSQEGLDFAREQLAQENPEAAAKLPLVYNAARIRQLADSSMSVNQQLQRTQAVQNEKDRVSRDAENATFKHQAQADRRSNQAETRELKYLVLGERQREFDERKKSKATKEAKILQLRPSDIKDMSEIAVKDYGLSKTDADKFSTDVISRTKQIQMDALESDDSITFGEARSQAIDELSPKITKGTSGVPLLGSLPGIRSIPVVGTTKASYKKVGAETSKYTKDNPAKPTTDEVFSKLSSGDWFINPRDGKPMRKK